MSIDWNKPLQTRDGRKVRIYAKDGATGREIHGAYWGKTHRCPAGGWIDCAWELDGSSVYGDFGDGSNEDWQLVNVPTPALDQTYVVSVRDLYGSKVPEAPTGYRFKLENGKVAFRYFRRGDHVLFTDGTHYEVSFDSNHDPRLILEPEEAAQWQDYLI